MGISSSLRTAATHLRAFGKLPLTHPRIAQLPTYVVSYINGRLAERFTLESNTFCLKFRLSRPPSTRVLLKPEHMGMLYGILEDGEYTSLNLPTSPKTILDLGANIGMAIIALHDQYPEAEFCAVEADPRNFNLLMRNLRNNHIQAKLFAAAAGASNELVQLRIGANSTCSSLVESDKIHPSLSDSIQVPVINLDSILNEIKWDKIDLLKIDIEGAEDELLRSSPSWLERGTAIIMEIHPNTTLEKIQSYLSPYGFHLRRHGHGREPVYLATR